MIVHKLLAASMIALAGLVLPAARAEPLGSTTSDAPNLRGTFIIHNPTSIPIHYQVKWGQKGKWQSYTVKPGFQYKHSHPLKNNMAPTPFVRFDNEGGDGRVTNTEVRMNFGRVGYAGYGPVGHVDEAWHYKFKYRTDGRHLDLIVR